MNWIKTSKWLTTVAAALTLAACGNGGDNADTADSADTGTETSETETTETEETEEEETASDFDTSQTINVVSREEGSGTRDAFTEITGVAEDDNDNTYQGATVVNGTDQVMTNVEGDPYAIGYVSLGSLGDNVTAVNVDGAEATPEAIQAGDYPIYRPFNIVYQPGLSEAAQEFINFIMSEEGQAIVEAEGYIASPDASAEPYTATEGVSGDVSLSGSTSVTPVMEALIAEFANHNTDVAPTIVASAGSGAGVTDAIEGNADIGMASREIAEDELSQGIEGSVIALDGIAVIVNNENPITDLTLDQVRQIFVGEVTTWAEVE